MPYERSEKGMEFNMNNTEIAKKYGIKEILPYFFTEDCLKFYSKNDREIIQKDTIGLLSLEFSEYEYDEDNRFYIKMIYNTI